MIPQKTMRLRSREAIGNAASYFANNNSQEVSYERVKIQ
jgi:hypothetical protein